MQKIKTEECIICKSKDLEDLFQKESTFGESFNLARCRQCSLQFLSHVPAEEDIRGYYGREYFTKRTDRGYDNYFSSALRAEIERVFLLNLRDLDFFEYEKRLPLDRYMLDIGCAAGYFVDYMKDRGWESAGVDISSDCVEFARKSGLDIKIGDYLDIDFQGKFHLITLWATLEHLHHPDLVLEKINKDLEYDGMLYISTCRVGGINFMRLFGKRWRFYNFPEHIYFFSSHTIKRLLKQKGFEVTDIITYGSGFCKTETRTRKMADFFAKRLNIGDMMLLKAIKTRSKE